MDIGLLVAQPKAIQPKPYQAVQAKQEPSTSFEQAFSEATQTPLDSTKPTQQATVTESTTVEQVAEEVSEVIEAEDMQAVLDILGIEYDESLAFVQINGELIAIEELMNLEDLTAALDMTPEQLQEIIGQLLGEEVPIDDVWQILEQAPALLAQVASLLQGEQSNVTPKEAAKVVEFLKLAQVVGMKTDTVYQQEFQLKEAKMQLQALLVQLATNMKAPEQSVTFQQSLKQVVEIPQATQATQATQVTQQTVQQVETTQAGAGQTTLLSQTTTKTVTVVLPTNTAAQSAALVKEIENAVSRSQLTNSQGQIKLLLKLYPENLGQIRVELFQKDGVMQARLLASSGQTKDLLDANLNQLKTALAGQNIQMDRIDITQSLQSTEQNTRDQNFFNNFFGRQQQEQEENKQEDEDQPTFEEFLQEQISAEEVEE